MIKHLSKTATQHHRTCRTMYENERKRSNRIPNVLHINPRQCSGREVGMPPTPNDFLADSEKTAAQSAAVF